MFFPSKDLTHATRLALDMLVRREEQRTRSRVAAYDNIADIIGMSSSWLQKFLRDSGEVGPPSGLPLQRFRAAYDSICERIEQENRADAQRLRELKVHLDAVAARADAEVHPENSHLDMRKAST